MRFIHTADWHLGRSFFNVSLIDDQAHALNQLIDIARESKPDLLILAGDVYDRAVPSTDAVKLLDDVLCRLILDLKLPTILIAGNHDSPLRLDFAARLVESNRLFVFGSLSEHLHAVDMYDEWGAVSFFPLPYAEPSQMACYLHAESITSHENAMQHWIEVVSAKRIPESRAVPICHAFVVGGEASESERPLDIGGASTVSASCFDDFEYVALGHLHRAQSLGANSHIHYSGSLLKYSFSEAEQAKCVKLVELNAKGASHVEPVALTPKRDVRCIAGTMDNLLKGAIEVGNREDYLQVRLLDKGAVFDAVGRLREVFPNLINIDHAGLNTPGERINHVDHRKREIVALFNDFYQYATGEALTQEQVTAFSDIVKRVRENERLV
jgi:exonuclease SbcD